MPNLNETMKIFYIRLVRSENLISHLYVEHVLNIAAQ